MVRGIVCCFSLAVALGLGCFDDELPVRPTNIEDALDRLGVDTLNQPRLDETGEALPDRFAPIGARRTVNRVSELMLFGVQLDGETPSAGRMAALDLVLSGTALNWATLSDPEDGAVLLGAAWRDAASGDFDGDGIEEVVVLSQAGPGSPIEISTRDGATGRLLDPVVVVTSLDAQAATIVAGDFDGDGFDELACALVGRDGSGQAFARLLMLNHDGEGFRASSLERELPASFEASIRVELAAGQVDWDLGAELAVAINRSGADGPRADILLLDDASTGWAVLFEGRADVPAAEGTESAVVADVALADVDGDGLDELLFAGLDYAGRQDATSSNYLVAVLDDAVHDFAPLAAGRFSARTGRLQPQSSGASHRLGFAHVLGADLDGDGAKEIVVNQLVFQSLRSSPGSIQPLLHDDDQDPGTDPVPVGIDEEVFFDYRGASRYDYNRQTSSMAAADVSHDGRDDIVFWSQRDGRSPSPGQELVVYGFDAVRGWGRRQSRPTRFSNAQNPLDGRVLLPNLRLGNDGFTLRYAEASHRLVFTEPLIIAALAAAPCSEELGQDLDACRTAYGRAVSRTVEIEAGISVTAGVTAGFSASTPVIPNAASAEVTKSVQATTRLSASSAYTVTKQVLRQTGPVEDSVIFTSIPLDIYSYEVLSHPDPNFVGTVVEVRLPREPLTAMVRRDFFNDNVVEGSQIVDGSVFVHTAGQPRSYRSAADKDRVLRTHNGLEAGPFDVGEGRGQTVVTISELTETSLGTSYELSASYDVKTTAGGVVAGFNVGGSVDAGLRVTRGIQTLYEGAVSNLDAANFARGSYRFGLFTYFHRGSGQSFEVVDYWVD